jgi:CHAT domain-containing protein/tetratricopeptide (TPR) repeat protein
MSHSRYDEARRLWMGSGYRVQAAVAHYAVAEQLYRASRLEEALAAVQAAEVELFAVEQRYFAARARGLRCLLLRNLGQMSESLRCSRGLPEQFVALGEVNDAANEWQNQGSIAVSEGRLAHARTALAAAMALDPSRLQPLTRGRVHMLAAALSSAEGRYGSALQSLEMGLSSFEHAANPRWQSNATLQAAGLYFAMGAWREAAMLAEAARDLLPTGDAPLRVAAARMLEARALMRIGNMQRAQAQMRGALEDYSRSAVPIREFEARTLLLQAGASPEEAEGVKRALRAADVPENLRLVALAVLAERAVEAGEIDEAEVLAREAEELNTRTPHDPSQRLIAARLDLLQGRAGAARSAMQALIESGVALALHAGSPELRHLAMRAVAPPRRIWIDAILSAPDAERAPAGDVWKVLVASQPQLALAAMQTGKVRDASALDLALSSALLPSQEDGLRAEEVLLAQRELMRYARDEPPVVAAVRLPDLKEFQSRLGPSQEALMLALGREHVLALHVTAVGAKVHQMGRAREVLIDLEALLTALSTRESRIDQIDALALALGSQLLPTSVGEQADSLLLLVDDELAAVPFALLRRTVVEPALLERVALSVVSGWSASAGDSPPARAPAVDVFVVPETGADDVLSLPTLHGAAHEPAVIESALGTHEVRRRDPRYPVLRDALRQSHAWVHIATHGATRGGLQGYSGLWLLPDVDADTGFVSWLRLLQNPIDAELVVLNACQLGESSDLSAPGAASFALAMSAAGAEHVVAARWRVSDAASAHWVEPFYRHLGQHGASQTGEALRQAQLRMRASRMFRHPYHWAGWMHLVRPTVTAGAEP